MAESKKNPESRDSVTPPEERGIGGQLNEGAPVSNVETEIRDAKHPEEKPDKSTIAQVEEIVSNTPSA